VRRLWDDESTARDLRKIELEVPQQLPALFLMDARDIERMTGNTPPLVDQYPRRITDAHTDPKTTLELASPYFDSAAATQRFFASDLTVRIWPDASQRVRGPLFLLRETCYRSELGETNRFAELDFYLRHTRLRVPVLEVLGSNEFRVEIARRVAQTQSPPAQAISDLAADALAAREYDNAIRWLEDKRAGAAATNTDLLLLTYVYCVDGQVEKAEAVASRAPIPRDPFVQLALGKIAG
jgi:hypothetical protein